MLKAVRGICGPAQLRRLSTGGHTVELNSISVEGGAGNPMVFIHGLYGSCSNFRSIMRQCSKLLRADRPIYCLDLRNHGASGHAESMDHEVMAADIIRFMDEHRIETGTLVGHSLGARTAMATALCFPDRVDKLMAVDMSVTPREFTGVDAVGDAMARMDLSQVTSRPVADELLAAAGVQDGAVRAFALQNLVVTKNEPVRWRINLPALRNGMQTIQSFPLAETATAPFRGKTTFLYGTNSPYVDPETDGPDIKKLFPSVDFIGMATGHWVHSERPKEFIDHVVEFIA